MNIPPPLVGASSSHEPALPSRATWTNARVRLCFLDWFCMPGLPTGLPRFGGPYARKRGKLLDTDAQFFQPLRLLRLPRLAPPLRELQLPHAGFACGVHTAYVVFTSSLKQIEHILACNKGALHDTPLRADLLDDVFVVVVARHHRAAAVPSCVGMRGRWPGRRYS